MFTVHILSLFNESQSLCYAIFKKIMFSSLQVFQQLGAAKKSVLTALTMTAQGGSNVNLQDNRKIYSPNPARREFLLGEFFFLSTFAAQATSL